MWTDIQAWESLPQDIRDELSDPEYSHRQHFSRATYALGCHGPLCRKRERDRGRIRYAKRGGVLGKAYTPVIGSRVEDPEGIDDIIAQHFEELRNYRLARRLQKAS